MVLGVAERHMATVPIYPGRRFPDNFAFQLTADEFADLRSHIAISSSESVRDPSTLENSSQFAMSSARGSGGKRRGTNWSHIATSSRWSQCVTSSSRHRGAAYRPWAFTEHGALMAANILRSDHAVRMSVYVIRAFVSLREELVANAAILKRLAEIDRTLLQHDGALREIYRKLLPLLQPPPDPPKRHIGFHGGVE